MEPYILSISKCLLQFYISFEVYCLNIKHYATEANEILPLVLSLNKSEIFIPNCVKLCVKYSLIIHNITIYFQKLVHCHYNPSVFSLSVFLILFLFQFFPVILNNKMSSLQPPHGTFVYIMYNGLHLKKC